MISPASAAATRVSDSTSLPVEDTFDLEGESITASPAGFSLEHITIFRPTADTVKRLKKLRTNQYMGPIRLIDKFDTGEVDAHLDRRHNHLVSLVIDPRKTHTVILTVKTVF